MSDFTSLLAQINEVKAKHEQELKERREYLMMEREEIAKKLEPLLKRRAENEDEIRKVDSDIGDMDRTIASALNLPIPATKSGAHRSGMSDVDMVDRCYDFAVKHGKITGALAKSLGIEGDDWNRLAGGKGKLVKSGKLLMEGSKLDAFYVPNGAYKPATDTVTAPPPTMAVPPTVQESKEHTQRPEPPIRGNGNGNRGRAV